MFVGGLAYGFKKFTAFSDFLLSLPLTLLKDKNN